MSDKDTLSRTRAMLLTALGATIRDALEDGSVTDILANADGTLWIDRHGLGRVQAQEILSAKDAERIIRLISSWTGTNCSAKLPIISAELPLRGERFEGLLPPVVTSPSFAIRKPATKIFTLLDYVEAGIMDAEAARIVSGAVIAHKNILVVGGTGSGKTTFVNALLHEMAGTGDRVLLLEDTRELQCDAPDTLSLRTRDGVSLSDLVRSTLRLRPDRIIIGEVRGAEALDMLKAWNTGHPGGVATTHANSALGGLYRLEQLVQEAVVTVPRQLIASTIDLIVFMEGRGTKRRLSELKSLKGLTLDGDYYLTDITTNL